MAATTPTLGLYKPGGGSSGLITPDETVDIDKLNANADLIDDEALSVRNRIAPLENQNRQYRGPAASLAGLSGMRLGDTYQETDDDFELWKYDGSNWIRNENGMYLIRPTSVTGGTLTDGKTVLSTGDTVTINGVFSTRFRRYVVAARWDNSGGVNGATIKLCAAGIPVSTNYDAEALVANGAAVSGSFSAGGASFSGIGVAGNGHKARYEFDAPGHAEVTYFQMQGTTNPAGISLFGGFHSLGTAYDGLRLELSTKGGGRAFTSGEIAVYGLA